jgi:hypothetical protein
MRSWKCRITAASVRGIEIARASPPGMEPLPDEEARGPSERDMGRDDPARLSQICNEAKKYVR